MNTENKYIDLLKEAENLVIDTISETMDDLYGVTASTGRLYGILCFKDEAMTLDDMSNELGMTKPSMSTSIRSLQQIDMVTKVWKKGVRKDLYQAEKDFFKSFITFFCKKWEREIAINTVTIENAEKLLNQLINDPEVPESIYEKAKINLNQLQHNKQYYKFLKKLVYIFKKGIIFEFIESNPFNDLEEI
ncbi:choline uptake/conversion transcriptional regulator CudC [Peribacillus simplex]